MIIRYRKLYYHIVVEQAASRTQAKQIRLFILYILILFQIGLTKQKETILKMLT